MTDTSLSSKAQVLSSPELLTRIFKVGNFMPASLAQYSRVNKAWYQAATSDEVWKRIFSVTFRVRLGKTLAKQSATSTSTAARLSNARTRAKASPKSSPTSSRTTSKASTPKSGGKKTSSPSSKTPDSPKVQEADPGDGQVFRDEETSASWRAFYRDQSQAQRRFLDGKKSTIALSQGHKGVTRSLGVYKNHLVSGGDDTFLYLWNSQKFADGPVKKMRPVTSRAAAVLSVAIGEKAILHVSDDNIVGVWNYQGKPIATLAVRHAKAITQVQFNETYALSASKDGTMKAFSMEDAKVTAVLEGHTGEVRCFDMFLDCVVSGSSDNTIKVWSYAVNNFSCVKTLEGHTGSVTSIKCTSSEIVSGSVDKSMRVWDMKDYKTIKIIRFPAIIDALATTPSIVAVALRTGEVSLILRGSYLVLRTLALHKQRITAMVFTPGLDLVTASLDETCHVTSFTAKESSGSVSSPSSSRTTSTKTR